MTVVEATLEQQPALLCLDTPDLCRGDNNCALDCRKFLLSQSEFGSWEIVVQVQSTKTVSPSVAVPTKVS